MRRCRATEALRADRALRDTPREGAGLRDASRGKPQRSDITMAHTYTRILIHSIFSTRRRETYLTSDIKAELFPYVAGSIARMKGKPR